MTTKNTTTARPLYVIANEISMNWRATAKDGKIYFGAVPYLNAMKTLDKITDVYGMDSGRSIIAYFLGNASTYRGETARRVKAELNAMLK